MKGYPGVYDYETLTEAVRIAFVNALNIDSGTFCKNIEENIIQLQNELIWKTYKISPFRKSAGIVTETLFFDFRDIVVQIALCLVIDESLIPLVGKKDLFIEMLNTPIEDSDILWLVNLFLTAFNL